MRGPREILARVCVSRTIDSAANIPCKPCFHRISLNVRMERLLSSEVAPAPAGRDERFDDFEALVEQHRPRIFRFILASLRNKESAENLTQDCFVRAFQARNQFRGEARAGTWLMQIAANLVRSHESSSRLKF